MALSCALSTELSDRESLDPLKQKTLRAPVTLSGIGLFTGANSELTICPSEADTGFRFRRKDLSGDSLLLANLDQVVGTPRCTILGNGYCTVHTVEHILAALRGMGIDNALLELSGPEVPILDGSAYLFVEALLKGGLVEQDKKKQFATLDHPVSWSKGDVHLVALPSEEFRISYTLHFPESKTLHSQYLSLVISPENFASEIASCRTFCFYEEIIPFIESGLIKGGGLDNAVIIKKDMVINPDGIRYPDEPVRHKILDLIGDLALLPPLKAHVIAIRSGHASNVSFGRELFNHLKMENV